MVFKTCHNCNSEYEKPVTTSKKVWATRKYCSVQCSGTLIKQASVPWNKGKKMSKEYCDNMSAARKGKRTARYNRQPRACGHCNQVFMVPQYRLMTAKFCSKECHYKARDFGKTTEDHRVRRSKRYKDWRTAVFERDNYTCQMCSVRGGKLNADHIKPFALYPELRFAMDNGRTLCEGCHKTTDTYGRKAIYRTSLIAIAGGY